MAIIIHRTGEHSPDVAGPRFFQKNSSLRTCSAHGEMLIEFKQFFNQSMALEVKNKERPKLIRFEEGGTVKDDILTRSGLRKNAQPDASTSLSDACNIQHHTTLLLNSLPRHLMEAA